MTDDGTITNRMLLEHIQASKLEMLQKFTQLEDKVDRGFIEVDRRFAEVDRRFEEARLHREALQEDLEATIKMQSKHERKLAVLTGGPVQED